MAIVEIVFKTDLDTSELGRLGATSVWLLTPRLVETNARELVLFWSCAEVGVVLGEVSSEGVVAGKTFNVLVARVGVVGVPTSALQGMVRSLGTSTFLREGIVKGLWFAQGCEHCGAALSSNVDD